MFDTRYLSIFFKGSRYFLLTQKNLCPNMLFLVFLVISGCSSAQSYYYDAVSTLRQSSKADHQQIEQAFDDLNKAISIAKDSIKYPEEVSGSHYDEIAYTIPLAKLAKAEIYGRLQQVRNQEQECWGAIRDAEKYLGKHLHIPKDYREILFASYSVFFRREKIRRQAFAILKESYERAGDQDLVNLMEAQIALSGIYLNSVVAHREEEYIREAENASWVASNELLLADIGHGVLTTLTVVATVAYIVVAQAAKQELREQVRDSSSRSQRNYLRAQMAFWDLQTYNSIVFMGLAIHELNEQHRYNVANIQHQRQRTVKQALVENFSMLQLSEQVCQLPEHRKLKQATEILESHMQNNGFDQQAAEALVNARTALDDLILETQKIRQEKERK